PAATMRPGPRRARSEGATSTLRNPSGRPTSAPAPALPSANSQTIGQVAHACAARRHTGRPPRHASMGEESSTRWLVQRVSELASRLDVRDEAETDGLGGLRGLAVLAGAEPAGAPTPFARRLRRLR